MSEPFVCVATRLHTRGLRVLPPFLRASWEVSLAARRTQGNLRTRLLGLPPFPIFFTLTVWESADAMSAFVNTPVHQRAMAHMDDWAASGEFVQFSSTT